MPRLLDNWLQTYAEWTIPRSEAPESLILWTGLFTIASVAKRHVCIPKSLMGSYDIYPNLYLIYVGPPGVVRKSTTAAYGESLLERIEHTKIASTAMSASKLIETLSDTIDGAITIISSEFANFVSISKEEMYDLLTDLYDGKVKYEYGTRAHGYEIVENPCVNMLGATTPEWISNQMPPYVIGGGFASRTLFVFESKVRKRQLYYNIRWEDFERLENSLVHDLAWIRDLKGIFKIESKETMEWAEQWYQDSADEEITEEKMEGYFNRKHVHLHKAAMLLSLAERNDLVITKGHFEAALELLKGVERQLPRVFSAVGKNPYAADIESVLDYIRDNGPLEKRRLLSRFYHNLTGESLKEILAALITMETIEKVPNPNGKGSPLYQTRT